MYIFVVVYIVLCGIVTHKSRINYYQFRCVKLFLSYIKTTMKRYLYYKFISGFLFVECMDMY